MTALEPTDATAMDEKKLTHLLQMQGRVRENAGWRCPDEANLAAYVERSLPAGDLARIEKHLSNCGTCLDQVVFLVRPPAEADEPVAPQLLARARGLVPAPRSLWRAPVVSWGTTAAAAACLVIAVGLFRMQSPVEPFAPVAPATVVPTPSAPAQRVPAQVPAPPAVAAQPAPGPAPAVRNSATTPLALKVLSPAENAVLARDDLRIQWRAVPGAAYYEAQVMTEDGTVAWSIRTDATSVRLPGDDASLNASGKHFVWIRAYLAGGGTVKSAAVSFHIADR